MITIAVSFIVSLLTSLVVTHYTKLPAVPTVAEVKTAVEAEVTKVEAKL